MKILWRLIISIGFNWVAMVMIVHKHSGYTLFFKNKVYKNVEPQICQNLKNILDAEIVNI